VTGDAALLVAPLDVNSLAAAMNRLLADEVLRREMSRKGLVQAGKFSWERTARETVNVYTGVVNP
jgi:glycosyltransferase involved in cell wall biosynthesis